MNKELIPLISPIISNNNSNSKKVINMTDIDLINQLTSNKTKMQTQMHQDADGIINFDINSSYNLWRESLISYQFNEFNSFSISLQYNNLHNLFHLQFGYKS